MISLVDSHCHLNYAPLEEDLGGVAKRMSEQGVVAALAIATELDAHEKIRRICDDYPQVRCTVGVHPCHVGEVPATREIVDMANGDDKVVAIGETGLDFFRNKDNAEEQSRSLSAHIEAARTTGKPLVIHTRNSFDSTIDQLRAEGAGSAGGVMHCFTGTWDQARKALDLGFMVSFTGIVTFKNAGALLDVVVKAPPDMYMVETDAPYLAPEPHRGKPNEPARVRLVAEKCAAVRNTSLERVAEETTANFNRLFGTAIGIEGEAQLGEADQGAG